MYLVCFTYLVSGGLGGGGKWEVGQCLRKNRLRLSGYKGRIGDFGVLAVNSA